MACTTYNFAIIKTPGTTNAAPFNLCTLPTIRSPNKNRALAENAEPKAYNNNFLLLHKHRKKQNE